MKRFTLTFVLLWTAGAFALAGPVRFQNKDTVVPGPQCAQFGGFEVGAEVGGALYSRTWNDLDAWVDNFNSDWAVGGLSKDRTGVTAGGLLGYNFQRGCALFGLEIDGNWADLGGTTNQTPTSTVGGTTLHLKDDLNWWGTARTRAGIVVDNLLLFVTGGFAYADIDHRWTITDTNNSNAPESFSADSSRWGGVAGGGAEWAFNNSWSLRSEFLYIYFTEDHSSGFSNAGNQKVHFDTQDSMSVARFSVVYHFWGGR
jgi:outer membrane immunogenic protein